MAGGVGHLNPVGSALLAASEGSDGRALACGRKNQRRFTRTGGPVDVITRVGAVSLDRTAAGGSGRFIRGSWPGDGGHYGRAVVATATAGRAGTANVGGGERTLMPSASGSSLSPQHQCLNANASTPMTQSQCLGSNAASLADPVRLGKHQLQ